MTTAELRKLELAGRSTAPWYSRWLLWLDEVMA